MALMMTKGVKSKQEWRNVRDENVKLCAILVTRGGWDLYVNPRQGSDDFLHICVIGGEQHPHGLDADPALAGGRNRCVKRNKRCAGEKS